jgi:7-cyano-7-deazaguanine synthase in queuosine biosynthesis
MYTMLPFFLLGVHNESYEEEPDCPLSFVQQVNQQKKHCTEREDWKAGGKGPKPD